MDSKYIVINYKDVIKALNKKSLIEIQHIGQLIFSDDIKTEIKGNLTIIYIDKDFNSILGCSVICTDGDIEITIKFDLKINKRKYKIENIQ
jgi:hypothetical protein